MHKGFTCIPLHEELRYEVLSTFLDFKVFCLRYVFDVDTVSNVR